MGDVDNIICAINPDKYYSGTPSEIRKYKNLIREQGLDEGIKNANPNPAAEHRLIYDSASETLEPVYFWVLDFMNNMFRSVTKITDNFTSSVGGGHFSELGLKKAEMQKQASTLMATINSILKSVINLLYDLKEFKIRLNSYEDANSDNLGRKESGMLALKQIWMDKVDLLRGQGSINAMASGNLQFVTLRDSFMIVNNPEEVDKLDLNDRVKRVLKPRVEEFLNWRKRSEEELRQRFNIEKTYLKSQVDSLKLQARWAKPYLKAAQQLEANEKLGMNPALVNAFNTLLLELTLMGKNQVDVEQASVEGNLPKDFKRIKNLRKYSPIVIVNFNFRGIPNKVGQHYTFGGRAEVVFKAYALNEDELLLLDEKLKDSDLNDSLKLVQGITDESLQQLKIDLDEFLETKEDKQKSEFENINPFSAIFGFGGLKKEKPKEEDIKKLKVFGLKTKGIKSESYAEKYIRNLAEADAINNCYDIYDIYKQAHGMASWDYVKSAETKAPVSEAEKLFGFNK